MKENQKMPNGKVLTAYVILSTCLAASLRADVGTLDKYECHNHQKTGEYHCHGPSYLAKLGGFIIGADMRLQSWLAGNRASLFTGIGINAEYNYRWLGLTAAYYYLPLIDAVNNSNVSLDDSIVQRGWEIGLKAGPNVGRYGSKLYLLGGWSMAEIKADDAAYNGSLNSYFIGPGTGYNTKTIAVDVAATYRDPYVVRSYAEDKLNIDSNDLNSFDIRLSAGWRF
jgi:hypothetical protein